MRAVSPLARAGLALLLLLAGCREIPPRLTDEYRRGPVPAGWPPLAAYHRDPFHPRNRWFHRTFSSRTEDGAIARAPADEPLSRLAEITAVDRAELAALLESALREDPEAGPAALLFGSDALAEAARVQARGPGADPDGELRRLLLGAAAAAMPAGALPPHAVPPPLRSGEWLEVEPPRAPELLPSHSDLRWTRAHRERPGAGAVPRAVIARSRIALDASGEPVLLELASECWEVQAFPERPAVKLFRFDRAEFVAGRDPWREVPSADAGARSLASLDPGQDPPAGAARSLQLRAAGAIVEAVRAAAAAGPASGGDDDGRPASR